MYVLIREDIVLSPVARVIVNGICRGDPPRNCREGGCNSGEKGFGSSVKEFFFFFFCVFGAILESWSCLAYKLGPLFAKFFVVKKGGNQENKSTSSLLSRRN